MLRIAASSLLAFAAGTATALAGPQKVRPVVKTVLKGAYIVGRKLQEIRTEIGEELEDIAAEVREDLATAEKQATKE